MNDQYGALVEG